MPGLQASDVVVRGSTMRYLAAGSGDPTLFLHGNPTSSFLWRDVLAALRPSGRRLMALDLIGMGGSGKPECEYRLVDHIAYVVGFLEALDLRDLTLVGHDWGVAIALECLRRCPDRVRAVALMEGHLRPLPGWDAFDEGGRELFQRLRAPGTGEQLVLEENVFIETLLPAGTHRTLTAAEHEEYRRPYPTPQSRRPLLAWAREIPVAGRPADVADLLTRGVANLAAAGVPALLVHGQPGATVDARAVSWLRGTVPGLVVADVGPASHFLPEDRPVEVAAALSSWWRCPADRRVP